MKLKRILRSITFRYIAAYVAVLSLSVFLLMMVLYAFSSYSYFQGLRDSILEELDTIELIYNGQGEAGVQQYIADQSSRQILMQFAYLLEDAQGNRVSGTLDEVQESKLFGEGWLSFELVQIYQGRELDLDFLARTRTLGGGQQILVARSLVEAVEGSKLVLSVLLHATIATLILGLVGGYISANISLQRVETLNDEIHRIVHGDLSQRLSVESHQGNLRDLVVNVNEMLDHTQSLMQGVRTVSDNIAHDLRTPLTRIRNALEQLREQCPDDNADAVQHLIGECDELLSTFNALLRISKLESGSTYAGEARVDLQALLQDAVELYEPLAQEKQQQMVLAGGQGFCRGDADLLFQLFANLVDNAIKYTPEGGQIRLQLSETSEGEQQVVVSDTGPGIPAADRQNVFRRFLRLESSRAQQPGNGLGLALVRAIVRYHRGVVELGDNDPGLRVRVSLPA